MLDRADTSALYGLLDANLSIVIGTIRDSITSCIEGRTFKDKTPALYLRVKPINIVTGAQLFKPITILFSE